MGRITTHVLDTSAGSPGRGIHLTLARLDGEQRTRVATTVTNADGRCDAPLLEGQALVQGSYELAFEIGDYFRSRGATLTDPPFLDVVVIRFQVVRADEHFHVPLLVTPWSYSTYRGS